MLHQKIYERLKEVARNGDIVPYSQIAQLDGLNMENQGDRNRLAHILGEISVYEYENGRPLLSAVVTFKDIPYPGSGFFEIARENTDYRGHSEMENLEFFTLELKRVHE